MPEPLILSIKHSDLFDASRLLNAIQELAARVVVLEAELERLEGIVLR